MSGFEGSKTKKIYILAKDQVRLEEPVDVGILEPSEVLKNQYESLTGKKRLCLLAFLPMSFLVFPMSHMLESFTFLRGCG